MRNNHTMRLAAALTCLALLLCLAPVPAARAEAPATPSEAALAAPADASAADEAQWLEKYQHLTGYLGEEEPPVPPLPQDWQSPVLLGDIPSSYDLRDVNGVSYVSPVRDQHPYGTCWAFGVVASAESNLLRQGYDMDLSELQLVNYTYNRNEAVAREGGGTAGDIVKHAYSSATVNVLMSGGNAVHAVTALSSRPGLAPEAELPYPNDISYTNNSENALNVLNGTLDNSLARSRNAAQFVYDYTVNIKTDPAAVKALLMESGAASVSYYSSNAYIDGTLTSHYCPDNRSTNHAVALCGWDDNYAVSNFGPYKPSRPGAWLCKNSWGDDFGDGGYFWISYEDGSIANVHFIGMAPVDKDYDNLYQYDGGIHTQYAAPYYSNTIYGASVFTAEYNEYLEAVQVQLCDTGSTVSIRVYTGEPTLDGNGLPNPTLGTLVESATVTGEYCPYAGVYTIPLSDTVPLKAGEVFSIVVGITMPSGDARLAYDMPVTSGSKLSLVTAQQGQNYMSPGMDYPWTDAGASRGNLRIKALTNDEAFIPTGVAGDVDSDNALTINDAVVIARYIVGLERFTSRSMVNVADVYSADSSAARDGVNAADVLHICRLIAEKKS